MPFAPQYTNYSPYYTTAGHHVHGSHSSSTYTPATTNSLYFTTNWTYNTGSYQPTWVLVLGD